MPHLLFSVEAFPIVPMLRLNPIGIVRKASTDNSRPCVAWSGELVGQLLSEEAFPSKTENRKGLALSPEGLRMPIWGSCGQ